MVGFIEASRDDLPYGGIDDNPIVNFFHVMEDLSEQGVFYGVDAPEFGSRALRVSVREGTLGAEEEEAAPQHPPLLFEMDGTTQE